MTALLLAPVVVLAVLAASGRGAPAQVLRGPLTGGDLAGGVLIAMWNYMGWDNASTVAGEVDRPQRAYPIAVLSSVALIALTYVAIVGAMAAGHVDPSGWSTGSRVDVGRALGGAPLAWAVVAGGMVSAFGMFNALCLSYSRIPAVLAEDGYLPRSFAGRLPRSGAPWVAVFACSLAWTLSLGLPLERLVSLDIMLYGSSLVLEFVALVVLRVREPGLPRPFKVPGGLPGAVLLGLGPTSLLGFALVRNAGDEVAGMSALVFGAGVVALGPVSYLAAAPRARVRPGPRTR